jgi:AcrR family transcriptional regulator
MTAEPIFDPEELSPAERRRLKVRDAIIDAAEQIFAEEGPAGLSMRRIAERIDYSPAALYKYFDSKEALIHEIREMFFERMLRRLEQVTNRITDGPQLCLGCMQAYIDTGIEHPAHYKLAFGGLDREDDKEIPEDSYAMAAKGHLRSMIQQSIDDGWFRQVPVELASSSVWAAVHGLTMLAITLPDYPKGHGKMAEDYELCDAIKFHADLIMRGLGAPKMIERLDTVGL